MYPQSAIARNLAIREAGRVAYRRVDATAVTPRHQDGPSPVGAAVYYRRPQVRRGETPVHRWFGVGRVVGHEGRGRGIWIRHGPSLILASPQQIRFAMEEELLASRLMADDLRPEQHHLRRLFLDVRDDAPFVQAPVDADDAPPAGEENQPDSDVGPAPAPPGVDVAGPPVPVPEPDAAEPEVAEGPVPVPEEPAQAEGRALPEGRDPAEAPHGTYVLPTQHGTQEDAVLRDRHDTEAEPADESAPSTTPHVLSDSLQNLGRVHGYLVAVGIAERGPDRSGSDAMFQNFDRLWRAKYKEFSAWLTGADSRRKKINLTHLTKKESEAFDMAMKTEWSNWLLFEAVQIIDGSQVPENAHVISTRWVHTDKNAIARAGGRNVSPHAKRRLVVHGHKGLGTFRSVSPTASLLSFDLVCSMAASRKWKLVAGVAPNAFLQGDPLQRLLVLKLPTQPPDENLRSK